MHDARYATRVYGMLRRVYAGQQSSSVGMDELAVDYLLTVGVARAMSSARGEGMSQYSP